jgi:lysophospholipid acyltransferase (LPLAT)-like uncharacterized protein
MHGSARGELTFAQRLLVAIGIGIVRVLYSTWRVQVLNDGGWQARRTRGQPNIFAFWHGHMLPLLMQHRGQGVAILISEHRDGELIARLVEKAGLRTVRGSTSRGAARALLALSRVLETGGSIGVTPDGPRGPAHSFAPGTLIAAQRSGVPITPIGVYATRAWRLRSWDAFMIPKPFARVVIAYGDPVAVETESARAAGEQTSRFQALMHTVEANAQTYGRDQAAS